MTVRAMRMMGNERGIKMKIKKFTKTEKVLIGATIVCTCAAEYFGYKYFGTMSLEKKLKDSVDTLMAAGSEGVFEEALATVGRKISYRKDREGYLLEQLSITPNDSQTQDALSRIRTELQVLLTRQTKFLDAQKLYEIKDENII